MDRNGRRHRIGTFAFRAMLVLSLLLVMAPGSSLAQMPIADEKPLREERQAPNEMKSAACSPADRRARPQWPPANMTTVSSHVLQGQVKSRIVLDVLKRPDVQNVLRDGRVSLDSEHARTAIHTLDTGNTLLAVGIPTQTGILIYYELATILEERDPEGQGFRSRYKSQAMLYKHEGEMVRLVATSINGRSVSLPRCDSPSVQQVCGDCTNLFQWDYPSWTCANYSWSCVITCGLQLCGPCAFICGECLGGNSWACGVCFFCTLGCGQCVSQCCSQWDEVCAYCGTPP